MTEAAKPAAATLATRLAADLGPKLTEFSGEVVKELSDVRSWVQWAETTARIIAGILDDARNGDLGCNDNAVLLLYNLKSIGLEGETIVQTYRTALDMETGERWPESFVKHSLLGFVRDDVNNMKKKLQEVMDVADRMKA